MQSKKSVITSPKAALPIGPYSQAIQVGNLIFVAGEKGIDRSTGKIVPGESPPKRDRRSITSKRFCRKPAPPWTTRWLAPCTWWI